MQITVAFRTADGEVVSSDGGHESHDGPVFGPATMGEGDTRGDIIPPFPTTDGVSYEGKNWPAGEATFDNGCEPVGATDPADRPVTDGDGRPDRAELPASGGDEPGDGERDDEDPKRPDLHGRGEGATEGAVTRTRQPDSRVGQRSVGVNGGAGAVEERALRAGLSVLIGGYAAVDAIRERMRRTD